MILEIPQGKISISDVRRVHSMNIENLENHDLSDLKLFTKLVNLYLSDNDITEVKNLPYLKSLKLLSLSDNKLEDISGIVHLNNLEVLWLSGNRITDISPLENLKNLRELSIGFNPISDLRPLSDIEGLEFLDISNTYIDNLDFLMYLNNIKRLDSSLNHISNISSLKYAPNLIELSLTCNNISDLEVISELTNLKKLHLPGNRIRNIDSLKNLSNLEYLNMTDNKIEDVSALANLKNIKMLFIINNEVIDFSCIKDKIATLEHTDIDYRRSEELFNKISIIIEDNIKPEMSDYEKVKAVHDYLAKNCVFSEEDDDYTAYGALVKGRAVCSGYTEAFKYLLREIGIECIYVVGESTSPDGWSGHAWNIVNIDGTYRHVDVTWDRVREGDDMVDYSYFCKTDEEMRSDHRWNMDEYPACE
jgi:internalin A